MKVTIEMETAEEREIFGAGQRGRFVVARSTAVFFRREMVPVTAEYTREGNPPTGYKEKLYVEVALDSLECVDIPVVVYTKALPIAERQHQGIGEGAPPIDADL